ncbi:glycosyltransferase family 8 protein [Campylobacter coli]|nr:glycosyltransferase family 8 protein [Campylobacter coli]
MYTSSLLPAFKENNIPIVLSSSEKYAKYLSVCLTSIKKHSSDKTNYDIVILDNGIRIETKTKLLNFICSKNFSLRFYDMDMHFKQCNQNENDFYFTGNLSISTYYRFFVPDIFRNYQKIIFIDADTLVFKDLEHLYKTNLNNHILGAVHDYGISAFYSIADWVKKCIQNTTVNIFSYFNAGVLLFDIDNAQKDNFTKKILQLNAITPKENKILYDQDILNSYFKGNIKYLDPKWNVLLNVFNAMYLLYNFEKTKFFEYENSLKHPYILHFAGDKPWSNLNVHHANTWWDYAKQTPFYNEIIFENMQEKESIINNKDNLLSFYSQHGTAKQRVQNQLSYKLGQVFIINSKTILETVLIPFFLLATIISHKQEQKKYQAKIKKDPSLKLPPLEEYPDYEEAIKFKNHLSYQLGQILISSFKFWYKGKIFTLPFKMMKLYKNFKQKV